LADRLATPERLQDLQRALHRKAKQEPTYRFYSLYDKVCRADILAHAYALSRANGGAAGVDGVTFADLEATGREQFLKEVEAELRDRRYRANAVRRVMIPKPDGGERPLGIPTIKDRVVQTAVKLLLEPIFEADLPENAYGYRPERSAEEAVREVHGLLRSGHIHVVDADLSKYFDTIPHWAVLKCVARRVADGAVLHLVKMWLKAPVEETDEDGQRRRRKSGSRGTPQGGVISPLLANLYMRRFLLAWEQWGIGTRLAARIVNYADDFVILCRRGRDALAARAEARRLLTRIGLTLNEAKTRVCQAWQAEFDFLGYTFGRDHPFGGGMPYLAARPSRKSVQRYKDRVRALTLNSTTLKEEATLVGAVNRVTRGWVNYFRYGTKAKVFTRLERFLIVRLRAWLTHKHKVGTSGVRRYPPAYLWETLGVTRPTRCLIR
jgi:RNA-directed DNA polymerase